uniref:Uncharacterized protein n=1 Tax=Avena sativa TaxID=4498 RepID=A0ACD5VQM3_AVESA
MAAPPPVLTLAVEKGPRKGETRKCAAGSALRIGRVVKGNHLAVRDVGASQQHLAIEFLPPPAAQWAVSDLGSSNGSFLNGAPLLPNVPTPLSHGDSIKIGESTVLAVSISSDLDLNPATAANPGSRRSARCATATEAMEEVKPPVVTRRGARKKAALAEIPEMENGVPDAAVVALEQEKVHPVTRRGGRGKAAAAVAAIPEVENEGPDAAVVVMEEEKACPVRRRGGRGKAAAAVTTEETEEGAELRRQGGPTKAVQPPELEEGEKKVAPVVTRHGGRKNTTELPELEKGVEKEEDLVARRGGGQKKATEPAELEKGEEKEAPVATRGGGQKKASEPAELEKEEEEEEEAVVVTRLGGRNKNAEPPEPEKEIEEEAPIVTRGRRKKNAATVAPPPQPPKTRSRRGQGRIARDTSAKAVLEDEEVDEEAENEVAASRELPGNLPTSTAVKTGEEEKGDKVAAGDVETEAAAKMLEEEVPKGMGSAQRAASDNVGDEEKGGGEEEDDGNGELVGSGGGKVKGAGRSSLETMTLGEWFDRMEKYLPRMINEAADKMIAELEEKHKCIHEYIATLDNSSDPS